MKQDIKLLSLFFLCMISLFSLSSCKESSLGRYEQKGGNPDIDFFELIDDSTILYKGPGGIPMKNYYSRKDKEIIIEVTPLVKARLHIIDSKTIQGEIPFFEGEWVKVK